MIRKEIVFGGKTLSIETGLMAKQANGSVFVQYGETALLAVVTAAKENDFSRGFFPLQVEFREKTYAGGKIPGGFFKREARPSEKEILTARLTDRPIRPMFVEGYMAETQIMITVVSTDKENPADALSVLGASAAICVSDLPLAEPLASVRVGLIDGEFIVNPTMEQMNVSEMDVIVAGTATDVTMVEGELHEVTEDILIKAIEFAQTQIKILIDFQQTIIDEVNPVKRVMEIDHSKDELIAKVNAAIDETKLSELNSIVEKQKRSLAKDDFAKALALQFEEEYPDDLGTVKSTFSDRLKANIRERIMTDRVRVDGRNLEEIRKITIKTGVLPRAHGSALFTRGETQALVATTLGTKDDEQIIDDIDNDMRKTFYLHYNFPPYSVGEVGRIGFTGRREIGHGNLAERALKFHMPKKPDFPYTTRIVSEILESNGSSSMASVCGGSLSLMDAGVGLKKTIAGIAMGLISDGKRHAVLSDILGDEDHYGDMDFKVTGSRDGVTAIQMDLKIQGLSTEIMREALEQAKKGREHIINIMEEELAAPRAEMSPYAPRYMTMQVDIDDIGMVIGPGGKNIKSITADTGATVDIDNDGTVLIFALDQDSADAAYERVFNTVRKPKVDEVFDGTVKRIMDFGAFVEILPGKEGLVHISKLAWERVDKVTDILNIGDSVKVKLLEVDREGRLNLSRRDLLEKPEGYVEPPRRERPERSGNRDNSRSGGNKRFRRD